MHEQSETVERDGKWVNIYGKNTPQAGQVLPGEPDYKTVDDAVAGAKKRSASHPPDLPPGFTIVKEELPAGFTPVEAPKAAAPTKDEPVKVGVKDVLGGIADTFSDKPLGKAKDTHTIRRPVDVIYNPQGTFEHLARAAVTAPAIYAGGAGLGALAGAAGLPAAVTASAPVAGRVLTSGALGAQESAAKGKTAGNITTDAALDMLAAGVTEGAVTGLEKGFALPKIGTVIRGLYERGAAARGYKWATEAVQRAVDAVASRLPKTTMLNIPSVSKSPVSLAQAAKKLEGLEDAAYEQTLGEIASELNRIDSGRTVAGFTPRGTWGPVKPPRPYAGSQFKNVAAPERFRAPGFEASQTAEAMRPYLTSDESRAIADALGQVPLPYTSIPSAALPPLALGKGFGAVADYVMQKGQGK